MNESTDTPQMAYLRRLEAKRNRAFEADTEFEREIIAAFRKTTGREYSRPIRTNEPLAGDAGFDWESRAPITWHDGVNWRGTINRAWRVLFLIFIVAGCCWALIRATQGWAR